MRNLRNSPRFVLQILLPSWPKGLASVFLSPSPRRHSWPNIRPITVLGAIYRLTGRVIFKQIVKKWATHFPILISGGLPGRGVKDLAFLLKFRIEEAIINKAQLGGFTLDLHKAFNTFPRWPITFLWSRLGVPPWVCSFWMNSLMRMRRFPSLHGLLGSPISSTTGSPEGDSLSVLAMLALARAFHDNIICDEVAPHGYADNWGWSTFNFGSHRKAFQSSRNFSTSLRLQMDFDKSWHWGITRDFREACLDHAHLFPSGDIPIKVETHMKDHGERFHYNKCIQLGNVKEKIGKAEARLKRIKSLPLDIQTKAKLIQSAIWPMALYSADTSFLGMTHFQTLRAAALYAFIGKCNFASPWLACFALSRFLIDPFLHVIISIARSLRRLVHLSRDVAVKIIRAACDFQGSRPFGPASTVRRYLQMLGWDICPDAKLQGPDYFSVDLLNDSCSKVTSILKMAWPHFLISNLSRKGTGDFLPHPTITARVLARFPSADQALLVRNTLGGFQTVATQRIWDSDVSVACPLCGEDDNRPHRCLQCPKLSQVRDQHVDVIPILREVRPDWVYIPLAQSHDELTLQRAFIQTLPHDWELNDHNAETSVTFYTDGGAINPTDPDARLAGWAVVSDVSGISPQNIQMIFQQ